MPRRSLPDWACWAPLPATCWGVAPPTTRPNYRSRRSAMNRHNSILTVSAAVLCIACSRQDTTADAAQVADATPAASAAAEGESTTDTAAAADASAMPPSGTAAPSPAPATAPVPASTSVTAPVATAPPVSNAADQATQAGAETDAPAAAPGSHDTVVEHAATTISTPATHAAMASHVHQ